MENISWKQVTDPLTPGVQTSFMGENSVNVLAFFSKGFKMKNPALTGKKYFYAIGQRVRAKGLSKDSGMELYKIDSAPDYARIAYDAGFRGLRLN
jgi:hypothetical protein